LLFGLRIERDLHFTTGHRLSEWADAARRAGSIMSGARLLGRTPTTKLSDPSGD
jgi:hypothetical protein